MSSKLPRAFGVLCLTLLSLLGNSGPALADGEILLGLVPSEDPSALVTDNQAIIKTVGPALQDEKVQSHKRGR